MENVEYSTYNTVLIKATGIKGQFVIPQSVEVIDDYAFKECTDLTSIVIPASVKKIGKAAFMDCSGLTSLVIPASVTEIGDDAFY